MISGALGRIGAGRNQDRGPDVAAGIWKRSCSFGTRPEGDTGHPAVSGGSARAPRSGSTSAAAVLSTRSRGDQMSPRTAPAVPTDSPAVSPASHVVADQGEVIAFLADPATHGLT